jgi:hypothetical protein
MRRTLIRLTAATMLTFGATAATALVLTAPVSANEHGGTINGDGAPGQTSGAGGTINGDENPGQH